MKNEYLEYTPDQLIVEENFISWINHDANDAEWQSFIIEHPEFKETVQATRILASIVKEENVTLSQNEVNQIWNNIDAFDTSLKQKRRRVVMHRKLWFASACVIAALVVSPFLNFFTPPAAIHQFVEIDKAAINSDSRLLLADGSEITIAKKESTVRLSGESININDDQTVEIEQLSEQSQKEPSLNEIIVSYGKRSELTLSDGTKVWLNAGSRMAFPQNFNKTTRDVFIQGEAYFEVAHNSKQPFIVHINDMQVKVLGTRFNVSGYMEDNIITTTLLEGSVEIQKRNNIGHSKSLAILTPNQKAVFGKEEQDVMVRKISNAEQEIGWVKGWLIFNQESLPIVLKELERYYDINFEYDAQLLSRNAITGKLGIDKPLDDVLSLLEEMTKKEFVMKNGVYHIN